jgi:hypothetical protein
MSDAETLLHDVARLEALVEVHRKNGEHEEALACALQVMKLLGILDEQRLEERWLKSIALRAS